MRAFLGGLRIHEVSDPPPITPPTLGGLLGRLGRFLGRLGAVLGRLGAVLGASWAVLERSWGPLGPSWSVGKPKGREAQKHRKNK